MKCRFHRSLITEHDPLPLEEPCEKTIAAWQ